VIANLIIKLKKKNKNMIHLLWCTLRPEQFKENHKIWLDKSDNSSEIKTYVAVNSNNDYEEIKEYLKSDDYIVDLDIDRIGVCYPSYRLTSYLADMNCLNDDIIIFASDDFLPPNNWDTYLSKKLENKGDVGLMVRDGYQLPDSSNMLRPAITIPIMTYGCLRKLNHIIYNPVYTHMFSDCELYDNLKDTNMLYDDRLNDETVFEHMHYASGKRGVDIFDVSYSSKWQSDETTWNVRKNMSIQERLILNF
jgi:hypothetical protein